jgi:hypothetical protein
MLTRAFARRAFTVLAGAALVVAAAPIPAQAATVSTTGARGRTAYFENGTHFLYASDPLTDGHCARWQQKIGSGSWTWHFRSACSGTEEQVGIGQSGNQYRICRTGVGNCSSAIRL